MSDQIKHQILDRVNLYDLISQRIKLQSRSGVKVGLCPFHNEKSPSFTVYSDHYFCFGCRESGDAISFVRKTEGFGYIDALKFLGNRVGVDTSGLEKQNSQAKGKTDLAYQVNQWAYEWFCEQMQSQVGFSCRQYLKERGFTKIDSFGYAPNKTNSLIQFLNSKGVQTEFLESISLAFRSKGQYYDFFRNRLVVPIRDRFSKIVAFGGRAMDDYPPKYKNSRESFIFYKSKTLFGFEYAKDFIRKGDRAILVEGYMDVLMLREHGFNGAVACMGTALRKEHLQLLANTTSELVLLFDGDDAGFNASLSTVKAAADLENFKVTVAVLPSNEDPDSYVQKYGSEKLETLLKESEDLFRFAIEQKIKSSQNIPILIEKELIPWIRSIKNEIQKEFLASRIKTLTGISIERYLRQGGHRDQVPLVNAVEHSQLAAKMGRFEKELLCHIDAAEGLEDAFRKRIFRSVSEGLRVILTDYFQTMQWSAQVFLAIESHRERVAGVDHKAAIEQLLKHEESKIIKNKISMLKSKLPFVGQEEQTRILGSISQMNKELNL